MVWGSNSNNLVFRNSILLKVGETKTSDWNAWDLEGSELKTSFNWGIASKVLNN